MSTWPVRPVRANAVVAVPVIVNCVALTIVAIVPIPLTVASTSVIATEVPLVSPCATLVVIVIVVLPAVLEAAVITSIPHTFTLSVKSRTARPEPRWLSRRAVNDFPA